MADEFASSRLGDLPNAGYATHRERELTDQIMKFIRDAERNRPWLLLMVVEGRDKFRHIVLKDLRGLRPADDLCNAVFHYLERLAGPNPLGQLEALMKMTNRERYGLM